MVENISFTKMGKPSSQNKQKDNESSKRSTILLWNENLSFCYSVPLYVNFKHAEKNDFGIPQPACNGCGNCVGGCNVGAKNTLNFNYLPDARTFGADIFTQVGALFFS